VTRRRPLVLAIGVALSGTPALGFAQAVRPSLLRVGVLTPSTQAKDEITLKPFYDQMRALGWLEGRNIVFDQVYADDQPSALSKLSEELVARQPTVIFAPPSTAALAAKQATQTIPIVFATVPDAVGIGLVKSLAHPGGNVTGISSIAESLTPKRIELLRQILPGVKRLGMLGDSNDPVTRLDQQALAPIAASLGLTLVAAEAGSPAEFELAVASLIANRSEAIFPGSVLAYNLRGRLIELTNKSGLPVIGLRAVWADSGALFSYGTSLDDQHRRSALLVDKVLRGIKPADIPVEQPTSFELVVNMKAARSLGIAIPRSVLLRANRVID